MSNCQASVSLFPALFLLPFPSDSSTCLLLMMNVRPRQCTFVKVDQNANIACIVSLPSFPLAADPEWTVRCIVSLLLYSRHFVGRGDYGARRVRCLELDGKAKDVFRRWNAVVLKEDDKIWTCQRERERLKSRETCYGKDRR